MLIVTSIQFIYLFLKDGNIQMEHLSLWGTSWAGLFGVVLFNFALVIAIPTWLYEKEADVHVPTVVQGSSILSAVLYILIGGLGAATMPDVSDNMLESMMSGAFGTAMQLGASIFAFFIIGLGIPLFSVLTRSNLTGSGLCNQCWGNILAVYVPFSISWLFYQGDSIQQLLSWGGIIFTSAVAFILPLLLAYRSLDRTDDEGSIRVYFWRSSDEELSKEFQKSTVRVLLALALLSILLAIVGNIIG